MSQPPKDVSPFSFDLLPGELQHLIASRLDVASLKNLRLMSRNLSATATTLLFAHVTVDRYHPDRDNFQSILASPSLIGHVTKVTYNTDYVYPFRTPPSDLDAASKKMPAQFESSISCMGQLPKLHTIALVLPSPQTSHWMLKFRPGLLSRFFRFLHGVPDLRSLTLRNVDSRSLVSAPSFGDALARIAELRMGIVRARGRYPRGESSLSLQAAAFFQQLPRIWLDPAVNLTRLALHFPSYWEYTADAMPAVNLGDPLRRLKSLELGKYVVVCEEQIEWILGHGETLEELVLDDVTVVRFIRGCGPLEYPGGLYPRVGSFKDENLWEYERSWSYIFSRFVERLPKLKRLVLGSRVGFPGNCRPPMVGLQRNRYSAANLDVDSSGMVWECLELFLRQTMREKGSYGLENLERWEAAALEEDAVAYDKVRGRCRLSLTLLISGTILMG